MSLPSAPEVTVLHDIALYADMLQQAADGVIIIDHNNKVVFFNDAAERLWGVPAAEVVGRNVSCLVPMEHQGRHDGYIDQNRQTGVNRIVGTSREVTFTRSTGDYVAAEMSISTALIGPEKHRYYMAFVKGMSEESHRRKLLELQSQVFTQLAGDATEQDIADRLCAEAEKLVPNTVATLLQVTEDRGLEILSGEGLPRRKVSMLMRLTLTDADVAALIAQPEEARALVWLGGMDDGQELELLDCWASAICNHAGELVGIFALYSRNRDKLTDWPQKIIAGCVPSCAAIIEKGKTQQRLRRLGRYDSLTGLLNRTSLSAILKRMTSQETPLPFALLVLDLDLFQDINNFLGHDQGDAVLRNVAQRLSMQCRSNFIISRLGGDDFVIVIPEGDRDIASSFAESLTVAMTEPIEVNGQELVLSFSIGISLYPDDGREVEQIFTHTEVAMRDAKKTARGSFRLLDTVVNDEVRSRLIIGSALRRAIRNSELQLFYQPQICNGSRTLYGVEALSRWQHSTLGAISPARFIPIAEETGQIEALGRWSMEEACRQMVEWDRAGIVVPVVSVNVSAAQFAVPGLDRDIADLLSKYELAPERLTIEITEGAVMHQTAQSKAILAAIREIGVGLSLDDFGTGFSSLSRLAQLPLTEIKIDRSFVMNFGQDVSSLIVTEAAITIGKRLGVRVVTEGVEDTTQEAKLSEIGCDVMQGYLFGRPMPPADIGPWMKTFASKD